jgi:hypothetical protein
VQTFDVWVLQGWIGAVQERWGVEEPLGVLIVFLGLTEEINGRVWPCPLFEKNDAPAGTLSSHSLGKHSLGKPGKSA